MPLLVPCSMPKPRSEILRCPPPTFPRKILPYSQSASNAPKAQPNNAQCAQDARYLPAESAVVATGQRCVTAQSVACRSNWRCSSSQGATCWQDVCQVRREASAASVSAYAIRAPSSTMPRILAAQPARCAARIRAVLASLTKQARFAREERQRQRQRQKQFAPSSLTARLRSLNATATAKQQTSLAPASLALDSELRCAPLFATAR